MGAVRIEKEVPAPPPGQHSPGGQRTWRQNKCFKLTKHSLRRRNFKLWEKTEVDIINNRYFFGVYFVISVRAGNCDCSPQGSNT
jgi:hypothetical protein